MQQVSTQLAEFINSRVQTPFAFAMVQMPTPDGLHGPGPQILLPQVLSYSLKRTQDPQSDTCDLVFADDLGQMVSMNPNSKYGQVFAPGVIDKKFIVYLGYRGSIGSGTPNFVQNAQSSLLKFTGYTETDAFDNSPFKIDKTVNLVDLTKQFSFQVTDVFPHPIYGDQNLGYFDPSYNCTSNDGITWQTEGRMFTTDASSKLYGSTHIDPAVYVDTTGSNPTSTPVSNTGWALSGNTGSCPNYSFDYQNGMVTFSSTYLNSIGHPSGLPTNSVVSLAGNPTYMAPENMIKRILVDFAYWDPNFLNLDSSNVLIPQFDGQGKSAWDCIKLIAGMTNPRFVPWVIWTDENGVINFYESRIDGPPVKTYLNGQNMLEAKYEYTSRNLRTVVRADATIYFSDGSDQPVTAIAYDVSSINKYGMTQPLQINQDTTQQVRHLDVTHANSLLTQLAASVLYQVSRPVLTLSAKVWPDYSLQIGDKVAVRNDLLGMDKEYAVTGIDEQGDATKADQTLTLTEYYETINMNLGLPGGVSSDGTGSGATASPPSSSIIGAVRLGSNQGTYVYRDGDYVRDQNGDEIQAYWNTADKTGMHFDVFFNSLPGATASPAAANTNTVNQPYSYYNLPPLSSPWNTETESGSGVQVHYIPNNSSDNMTYYVGPDSIFYKYHHASGDYHILPSDMNSTWVPTGNTGPVYTGNNQSYTGQAVTTYMWQWWYLCLDSNLGQGKFNRPFMRVNPGQDGAANAVPATGGLWVPNTWSGPPGPKFDVSLRTGLYGNLVTNVSNYTYPPTGFIGANVMGDGALTGVAYGTSAPNTVTYVDYRKKTKGHYCVLAMNSNGARQFLRIPFWLTL